MNVSVTGGSGFIGKLLCEALDEQDVDVTLLSRQQGQGNQRVVLGDLTIPSEALDLFVANCDVLYHCAGEIKNTEIMYGLHVRGTANLLAAVERRIRATNKPFHWVQLSSTGAYGAQADVTKVNEKFRPAPVGDYEVTKTISDELVISLSLREPLFTYTIVRPSVVIGPTMPNQSVFQLADMVRRKLFFYIGESSKNVATYVHVEDVVRALLACGADPRAAGETFIVSNDCPQKDVIEAFARYAQVGSPRVVVPEAIIRWSVRIITSLIKLPLTQQRIDALVKKGGYDSGLIQERLGFSFKRSIPDSIPEFLAGREFGSMTGRGNSQ